jgi:hypothetical protein
MSGFRYLTARFVGMGLQPEHIKPSSFSEDALRLAP